MFKVFLSTRIVNMNPVSLIGLYTLALGFTLAVMREREAEREHTHTQPVEIWHN